MEISKAVKNDIPYIFLKPCPICGEHPELRTESMGRPDGHGYPGHYMYLYRCGYCKLLDSGGWKHDIYDSPEEAKNRAKDGWNTEVDRIQNIIDRREKLRS